MASNWQQGLWQLSIAAFALGIGTTNPSSKLLAQITPDGTLGAEGSVVNPDVIKGIPSVRIDGGAIRGSNLFHSFQEFNIGAGRGAYFSNPAAIENIFSRVTGSNPSHLFGTLGVLGNANLFFLNPNGIIFGPNASLDLRGSFLGSTASSIAFPDGTQFSATNPEVPPLLTVKVKQPIGLRFEGDPGTIINQSRATNSSGQIVGLQVQPGQTIGLLGGKLNLSGGHLTAPGGRIELGAVAGKTQVSLNSTESGFSVGYEGVQNFQDIQLFQQAVANTSGEGGGSIQVQGGSVTLTQDSSLVAETLGSLDSGGIDIRTEQFKLEDESFVSAGTFSSGKAGDLTIETGRLLVRDGAVVSTSTYGSGDAGDLTVTAESVEMIGQSKSTFGGSLLLATVSPGGTGNGGNLTIETRRLLVRDGAQVGTGTFGSGDSGDLMVIAQSVELIGTSADDQFPSALFATVLPGGTGDGGNLTIETGRLLVRDGAQIATGTNGSGDSGDLMVIAQSVELIGTITGGRSGLFASTLVGSGDGGDLTIVTDKLTIQDGATISVSNFQSRNLFPPGSGLPGNINVQARSILLDNQGTITAESAAGNQGNIVLQSQNILLRRGSAITTNALGDATGGNITIDADFIIAFPNENSDITANAFTGNGGRISIIANSIFGIEPRLQLTPLSDITASSDFGAAGIVEINTPEVDPNRGLTNLPEETVEVEVVSGCQAGDGEEAVAFFNIGRGGLPPSPHDPLRSETIIAPWIPLMSEREEDLEPEEERDSTASETSIRTWLRIPCQRN